MIEGVVVGIRQGDRVMVPIAVHERQGARPVDQPEAQDRLEEALGHRHVAAIDDNMGKTKGAIMAVAGLAGQAIAVHDPQEPPVRVPDRETDAAAGLGHRRHRRHDRAACRLRGRRDPLQISCAVRPERDVAKRRPVGLVQRQDMGVGSRCPEVNRIARPVRHRQAPDAHEEVLGCIDIGNVQCNAAQSGNTGRCHR